MPLIDLHFHSIHSDGKLTIPELAALIENRGLKYCALTDHDTVAGVDELKECLRGRDVAVISGVELTALFRENEIHILAYDFNTTIVGEILKERDILVQKQKIAEMQMAADLFRREGLEITANIMPDKKRPVGYTLAVDICSRQFNQDLLIKKHGKIFTPDDIYFEYQSSGKACAVKRSGISVEWLLNKIRGKATDLIIAHPFLKVSVAANPLSEDDIFSLLNMGLNGLEIYHDKVPLPQIQWLKKMADEKKLHYTGGSDFHGNINDINLGLYGHDLEIPDFKISNFELI